MPIEVPQLKVADIPASEDAMPGQNASSIQVPQLQTPEQIFADRENQHISTAVNNQQYTGDAGVLGLTDAQNALNGSPAIVASGATFNDPNRDYITAETLGKGLVGIPLALADTVGRSVGLWGDDSVKNYLNNSGLTEFGSFYARNKQVLETTADTLGMFIPGTLAMKALEGGRSLIYAGKLGETLKDSTAIGALLGNGAKFSETMGAVREAALYKKSQEGFLAGKDYGASLVSVLTKGGKEASTFGKVRNSAVMARALEGLRKGVAFELGVYGFMNDSNTLYPKENTTFDNLKWAAIGPALGVIGEVATTKYAIRQVINNVTKGVNPAADTQGVAEAALDTLFRPGERGPGITTFGVMRAGAKDVTLHTPDVELRSNLTNELNAYDNVLVKQFKEAGADRNTILNSKFTPSDIQSKKMLDIVGDHPTAFSSLMKFDKLPDSPYEDFYTSAQKKIANLQAKIDDTQLLLDQGADVSKVDAKLLETRKAEIDQLRQAQYHIVENTGDIVPFETRVPKWLDTHDFKDISVERATKSEAKLWKTTFDRTGNVNRNIAVDANFNVIVPKSADIKVEAKRVNLVQRIGPQVSDDTVTGKFANMITTAYRPSAPAGKAFLNSLSPDARSVMVNWTKGGMSQLRSIYEAGDPKGIFNEIYRASQPLRDSLKELAAAERDGAILLYRGESAATAKGGTPASDVASFATRVGASRRFSSHVIGKYVNVDDIVAVAGFDGELEFIVRNNKLRRYTTDDNLVSNTVGWSSTNSAERSAAFAVASKALKEWTPETAQKLVAAPDLPWFTLESIDKLLSKHPEADRFVKWTQQIPDVDSLRFHILGQKFTEYNTLMDQADKIKSLFKKQTTITSEEVAAMLNLPTHVAGQQHPILDLFGQLRLQGDRSLVHALSNVNYKGVQEAFRHADNEISNYAKLQKALGETIAWPKIGVNSDAKKLDLSGKLFDQADMKPVMMMSRPVPDIPITSKGLIEQAQYARAFVLNKLTKASQEGAPLVGMISDATLNSRAFQESTKIENIRDNVAASSGVVTDQGRVLEQNPVTNALNMTVAATSNVADTYIKMISEPIQPLLAEVLSPKNSTALFEFNQIEHAYRYGWDIAGRENGRFVLANSTRNKTLWRKLATENKWDLAKFPEDTTAYLPNMARGALKQYTPLEVSELAGSLAEGISNISKQVGKEVNYLKEVLGETPIRLRDFHLPTPALERKSRWVILNEQGKPINVFAADTNAEAEARASAALREYEKENPGRQLVKLNWETVQQHNSIFNDEFQTFIDYSDPIHQTGKAAKGGLFNPEVSVGPQVLKDTVLHSFMNIRNVAARTRAVIYEPQLNYARMAHEVNAAGKDLDRSHHLSIWEQYANAVYDRQTLKPNSWIGRTYNGVESFFDTQMRALYNKYVGEFSRAPGGAGGPKTIGNIVNDKSDKVFEKLKKELTFDPFGSTEKFLRDTYNVTAPTNFRNVMYKANSATAALTFRMFDVGTAMMNMGSLMTTFAPVIRSVRRLPGETMEAWKARTGAWTSVLGENESQFDWVKASANAAHYVFTPESADMFKRAAAKGYFTPEAQAMHEAFITPVESMNAKKFDRFMKAATWFADGSERLSRKLAFGMGYHIAKDLHKMDNENDAFMFAHKIMTEMIGDYRPSNKPQMFQGALGVPLGMFQTYMLNYYRRLYSYIERGDLRTLAVQYAMQASIYGAQTVPGFDVYANTFASNYDGTSNPIDNFRKTYGDQVGDWFMYGTLSNIPKFLAGPDGGIAFYPRGDVNFNAPPTALQLQNAPAFKAAATAFKGANAVIDMFRNGGHYSNQQMLEIMSHYSLNRTSRNIFEIAAGVKTDRSGAVVESDTRDMLGITARLLGATKMLTQKQQETYYRQAGTEHSQQTIRDRLNLSTRALIQGGDLSVENLQGVVRDYLESGGNPAYFGAWVRNNAVIASASRNDRKLVELMKSKKGEEFMRFLQIMQPDFGQNGE